MRSCPKCGFENKAGKFCMKCGSKLFEMTPEVSAEIDILKKRIEMDSLNPKLYHELADIYYQNNMLPEALLEYQKVLNLDNSLAEVHLKCGDIYIKMKEFEKAQASYEKALAINPDLPEVKIALFNVHRLKDDFDKAIKAGEEILFSQPTNIEIHKSLKDIYLRRERYQDAMRELEILFNLTPNDIEVLNELAQRYELHNENEKAFTIYQKLQALQPNDLKTVFFIGKYYCLSGSYEKCIEYLKHNVAKMSGQMHSSANLYLALCFINQGNSEEANKHIAAVTSLYDEELSATEKQLFGETYYKIGRVRFQSNNFTPAIESFSIATKYDPENQKYRKELELARSNQSAIQDRLKSKKLKTGIIAIIAVIVITAAWLLTHGKIEVRFEGGNNAKLFLDGEPIKDIERTQNKILLTPTIFMGSHSIALEQDGYERWEGITSVGFGRITEIITNAEPAYGYINIITEPVGASIYIDGKLVGKSPLSPVKVQAIEQQVKVEKEGYLPSYANVRVSKGYLVTNTTIYLKNLAGWWGGYRSGDHMASFSYKWGKYSDKREAELFIEQTNQDLQIELKIKPEFASAELTHCKITAIVLDGKVSGISFENYDQGISNIKFNATLSSDWNSLEGFLEYDYYNPKLDMSRVENLQSKLSLKKITK